LDRVSTDRPVVVSHISGHFAVANTRALQLAGLHDDAVARDDGRFPRGDDGRLTGMLWEIGAVSRVFDLIPAPTRDELRAGLLDTLHTAVSRGITTLHDLGVGLIAGMTELEVYRALDAAGELPLHVAGFLRGDLPGAVEGGFDAGRVSGARFRLAGAKFWADGSIQGLSAALRIPYQCRSDHRGELLQDTEALGRLCRDASEAGAQVAVHANGDAAVQAAIAPWRPCSRTVSGWPRIESSTVRSVRTTTSPRCMRAGSA
ncbi:amidohydrolase family protein, partial [Pseudonocardia sp. KRD291]|uniref:amidohydrolase family protein n=1 Tax=Pseudonocardia sp. KRD291 TaxID=2792007 RepID=UPI001C49F4B2